MASSNWLFHEGGAPLVINYITNLTIVIALICTNLAFTNWGTTLQGCISDISPTRMGNHQPDPASSAGVTTWICIPVRSTSSLFAGLLHLPSGVIKRYQTAQLKIPQNTSINGVLAIKHKHHWWIFPIVFNYMYYSKHSNQTCSHITMGNPPKYIYKWWIFHCYTAIGLIARGSQCFAAEL